MYIRKDLETRQTEFDLIPQADGRRRVWWMAGMRGGWRDWRHVGWLMPEVENHVKEQPTNRYKQMLIDKARAAVS